MACRILSAIPLSRQLPPIAAAYFSLGLLFDGTHLTHDWLGLASFVLLFLQLRLIDDLDDRKRDRAGPPLAVQIVTLSAISATLVALNWNTPTALAAATAATLLAYAAPFVFKRLFPRSLAVGSLLFEGAPLLIFAFAHARWRDVTGLEAPNAVAPIMLFWAAYEVWKFSRKINTGAMQPYFLPPAGIRTAIAFFLLVASLASLAISPAFAIYAVPLCLLTLLAMHATRNTPRPFWSGMAFVAAIEAGILLPHAIG